MTNIKTVPVPLQRFGTIIVTGPDARSFLQGQLSADINRLTPEQALLACCNSSQGRVQGILWLIQRTDGLVLIVPASMLATTIERLRKYMLRAKVQLHSGTDRLMCHASDIGPQPGAAPLAASLVGPRAHRQVEDVSYVNWPGARTRFLVLSKPSSSTTYDASAETAWHLEDLRAGLPQVYPQTHESFVAQMLNLDLLDGISFEKGCYTGQEIIARTHFRGAIKRRMFRFSASCEPPAPGTRLVHEGQHAGEIVDAAPTLSGCEMLAVVNLTLKDAALQIDGDERGVTLQRLEMAYEVT